MNRKLTLMILAVAIMACSMAVHMSAQARTPPEGIDINAAPPEKLMTLSGIDIVLAKKIIAGRPYKQKTDLTAKKVLTKDAYDKIANYIVVKQADKPAAPAPAAAAKKGGKKP